MVKPCKYDAPIFKETTNKTTTFISSHTLLSESELWSFDYTFIYSTRCVLFV